jgi:hypothetical protein
MAKNRINDRLPHSLVDCSLFQSPRPFFRKSTPLCGLTGFLSLLSVQKAGLSGPKGRELGLFTAFLAQKYRCSGAFDAIKPVILRLKWSFYIESSACGNCSMTDMCRLGDTSVPFVTPERQNDLTIRLSWSPLVRFRDTSVTFRQRIQSAYGVCSTSSNHHRDTSRCKALTA